MSVDEYLQVDLRAVEELVDEFWITMHFETRRICTWYQQNDQSLPTTAHERGIVGAVSRRIGVEYAQRAKALNCPVDLFLALLDERKGRMYRSCYEPQGFN